jgi:hypothetical protein
MAPHSCRKAVHCGLRNVLQPQKGSSLKGAYSSVTSIIRPGHGGCPARKFSDAAISFLTALKVQHSPIPSLGMRVHRHSSLEPAPRSMGMPFHYHSCRSAGVDDAADAAIHRERGKRRRRANGDIQLPQSGLPH